MLTRKNLAALIAAFIVLFLYSPAMRSQTVPEEARALIVEGKAECVLVKDGVIVAQESGHGVSPLLNLYDAQGEAMRGAMVVDKVIGRAAASVAICGGAVHVHGELMSEDAVAFLSDNGITSSYTTLVPCILNRRMDGLCPLEQSVLGLTDPQEALTALRRKVAQMQSE